jgi:hypothetical protein
MTATIQLAYYLYKNINQKLPKYDMNMLTYLQKNGDRNADTLYVHFNIE